VRSASRSGYFTAEERPNGTYLKAQPVQKYVFFSGYTKCNSTTPGSAQLNKATGG